MPNVPQVRRLPFNDEEIGMGFNSRTGHAVGTALEGFTIMENPTAPGAELLSAISIVSTHEELQDTIGMSFDAQGRYGLLSGSVKAQFAERTNFNSMSTFVVASVVVEHALRCGRGFKVMKEAEELLRPLQMERFERAFGDSFVRRLHTGGEFYAVVRITSVSTSVQMSLSAALQAEYNGLATAGSFRIAFERTKNSAQTRSEFTAVMYQRSGSGATISPTVTIEEVIERFKRFPEIAAASAAAYETEVATYDTIPLPLPTPVEQEAFIEALADARGKKAPLPPDPQQSRVRVEIPGVLRGPPTGCRPLDSRRRLHPLAERGDPARGFTVQGRDRPPQFFDPGLLVPPLAEPEPLPLRKRDTHE